MLKYYLSAYKNYANFSGRATRTEYWVFSLTNFVIFLGTIIILGILDGLGFDIYTLSVFVVCILLVFTAIILVPTIAISVRRLHDINYSGFWYFIKFAPVLGRLAFVIICFLEGTHGDNKYGADPRSVHENSY